LACTNSPGRPCARNSAAHTERAKKPRASAWRSSRTSMVPASPRGSNFMSAPVKVAVDLIGRLQVLQLLEAREGPELVALRCHLDVLEQPAQLLHARARTVATLKSWQLAVNAVEIDAVAAVGATG